MKKCPYCHAELQDEASFCLYCMRDLDEKVTIAASKKRIPKKVKIIICIVLAVAVAASAVSYTVVKNSKICTFSRFYECFQAVNEKLGYEDLWSVSELKDYYEDENWVSYSLPLKNDDIEIGIYFYKGGKEILAVIGAIPEEDFEDTKKMALCITDSVYGYYINDFMDILDENENYRFYSDEFSYPENIKNDFRFIKEDDIEKANITSKHIETKLADSNIRLFYEKYTFDYGNKKTYKMILYYYPKGVFEKSY